MHQRASQHLRRTSSSFTQQQQQQQQQRKGVLSDQKYFAMQDAVNDVDSPAQVEHRQ
jgi:hypothetical protein